MAARSSTTKHDVALAEVHRKADREAVLVRGLVVVAVLAILYLPLTAIPDIVEPFAGKTTRVDVNFIVSITIALSLVVNAFQFVKGRSRRRELKRQRMRLEVLEGAAQA